MKAIWPDKKLQEKNYHCAFVASVTGLSENAVLRLAAESLYRVHINGHFAGVGPVRCAHGKSQIDTFYLKSFSNGSDRVCICVEVTAYNISVLSDANDPPFFAAQILDDGKTILDSDGFSAYELEDAEQIVPRYSWQRHFLECYNMKQDRTALYNSDTSGLKRLPCVDVSGNALSERTVSYPEYSTKWADTPMQRGRMIFDDNAPVYNDRFMHGIGEYGFPYESIKDSAIEAIRCFTYDKNQGERGAPSYALYDLGENLSGFIRLELDVSSDATIYVVWDEILDDDGNINPLRMRMANTLRLKLGKGTYSFEAMEAYTMKYINIVTVSGEAKILKAGLRRYENPNAWRLEFSCADKRYERLIRAAQSTLAQNSTDIFMDCPSRERAGWLCDSYFMGAAEWLLSGGNSVEKHFLENYADCPQYSYYPKGMIPKTYPGESPIARDFIPNWTLWYITELAAYSRRTGDRELVNKSKRIVDGLVEYFRGFENEYGLLEDLESWVFVEWSKANDLVDGVNFPSNMLYAAALSDVAELYGNEELEKKSQQIKKKIRELSLGRGLFFRDHAIRKDGRLVVCPERTETCQYYAFYFGIANGDTDSGLLHELVNKFGYYRDTDKVYPDVHKSNAFIGNLLRLCYLCANGYADKAVKQAMEFYLYMVDKTGTLWEYDDCQKSCCHGFASYIAVILLRGLVGYESRQCNKLSFLSSHMDIDCTLKLPLEGDRFVTVTVKDGVRSIDADDGIEICIKQADEHKVSSEFTQASLTSQMRVICDASKEGFEEYVCSLVRDGYKEISSNSFGRNCFVSLAGKKNWLFVSYHDYCNELHIISDEARPLWLYEPLLEGKQKIKFAQYDTKTSYCDEIEGVACGMGYLFLLSDGRFVAIDGGLEGDCDGFTQLMKNMSGEQSPKVALWIITHPHGDHYGALKKISHKNDVIIENYYSCMPPKHFKPQGCKDMLEGIKDYAKKNITAHTGDKFTFGGVCIETLLTCEEMLLSSYEQTYCDTNNLSVVLKFTVDGQSILFAADARTPEYCVLENVARDVLASDILQVSHHGRTGRAHEDAFVSAVHPSVALWPGNHAQINHDRTLGANNWIYSSKSSVCEHIFANDGRFVCELPYTHKERYGKNEH